MNDNKKDDDGRTLGSLVPWWVKLALVGTAIVIVPLLLVFLAVQLLRVPILWPLVLLCVVYLWARRGERRDGFLYPVSVFAARVRAAVTTHRRETTWAVTVAGIATIALIAWGLVSDMLVGISLPGAYEVAFIVQLLIGIPMTVAVTVALIAQHRGDTHLPDADGSDAEAASPQQHIEGQP